MRYKRRVSHRINAKKLPHKKLLAAQAMKAQHDGLKKNGTRIKRWNNIAI